jgi:hypothetical protein
MSAFLIVFLAVRAVAQAGETVPPDVKVFTRNAEACEHFAGEFDSDLTEARKKEIQRSVEKYCGLAQRQLKTLTVQYKNDARITEIIRYHANEAVIGFR